MHKDGYDNEIKNSLDKLNPTKEQSMAMWERLEKTIAEREDENQKVVSFDSFESKKKPKRAGKILTRVAAAIMVVFVAFGIDKVTGGHVYAKIMDLLNIDQGRQDIVGNIDDDIDEHYNIYAPNIYHMDGEILVFGGLRGLIIYDLNNNVVAGTIDTQKIDCVYFNSDTKETHIVKDEDKLVVFNSENDKPYGDYYIYSLDNLNGGELEPVETGNDTELLKNYYSKWMKVYETYVDTFDMAEGNQQLSDVVYSDYTYGELSFSWKSSSGENCNSFLIEGDKVYVLYTYNNGDDSVTTQDIDLSKTMTEATTEATTNSENVVLTEYVYTGDNKAVEAIYNYLRPEYMKMFGDESQIYIPAYIIYQEIDANDEYLVFGNFYIHGYKLTGNILESESGASMPGCAHLKRTDNGFEVVSMEFAGDGEYYEADIREFTSNYPEVYDMYFDYQPERDKEIREEYIRMYVTDNNLSVEYYKDYGWDPVKLFD
ncbi:MAG: hypothetical protein E7257_07385 [Lachnospiraceae bacterium]|nr:hypothetical protein [Lachnospiraceae bacterium]